MKGVVSSKLNQKGSNSQAGYFTNHFLISPFKSGITGFIILFTVLVISELTYYFLGKSAAIEIDSSDLLLAMLGFVLGFLTKFFGNLGREWD